MIKILAVSVFYLAVSGVASDYAADPYRNEVHKPLPQSTQLVEGVYRDVEAGKTVQAQPCLRHSHSGATQVGPHPDQNDNSAQNKKSPYGNTQSGQAKNLKAPSNYENNYKHGPPSDPNSFSGSNSDNQYSNPGSELKNFVNARSAQGKTNQYNVANTPSTADQASVQAGNLARANNEANAANLAQALNAAKAANQLKQFKHGSENSPPHFNNPATNYNSAKFSSSDSSSHQYQSQLQGPVAVQLTSANHLKNTQSLSEGNDEDNDDHQYNSLVANSRYDSSRRTNKRQDFVPKNENNENCRQADSSRLSNNDDLDTRREQELYRFINDKLSEDYDQRNGNGHQKQYKNKASQEFSKSKKAEDLDPLHQDEYEAYSPPSENGAENQYESEKLDDNEGVDESPQNDKKQKNKSSKAPAKQSQQGKSNQVNNYDVSSQAENDEYDEFQTKFESKNKKPSKNNEAANNPPAKNGQTVKHVKNSPHGQGSQKGSNSTPQTKSNLGAGSKTGKEQDEENSAEYKSEEDYQEDYKDDLSEPQNRRGYNHHKSPNLPQSDCDSQEVEHQQNRRKNYDNSEVEEVDVTARSGRAQKVLVGEHTRVCYACSSASDPTCLNPNKQTTVKYCQRGHDSCVTKVFKTNGIDILTRDCGTTCNDNIIPGLTPNYKKCSVCHSDLCNGAFSLNSQNVFFICTLAVITITKYFM